MAAGTQHGANSPTGTRTLHTLDALRGVAAIAVIAFHYPGWLVPLSSSSGYLAVDLFFVMSGIVIARSYDPRFASGMRGAEFLGKRLIRLYPLYALGTLLGLTFRLASVLGHFQQFSIWELLVTAVRSAFFIPSPAGPDTPVLFPLDLPAWSLFWELIVNVLFAFSWRFLTTARLATILLVSAASLIFLIISSGNANGGFTTSSWLMGFTRAVFGFAFGVLLARHTSNRGRRPSAAGFVTLLGATVILLSMRTQSRAAQDIVCILALFPLIAYLAARIEPPKALQPVATFLGSISYALYLLSFPLLGAVNVVLPHLSISPGGALTAALLAALLATCWLADRIYDVPLRRFLAERLRQHRRAGSALHNAVHQEQR